MADRSNRRIARNELRRWLDQALLTDADFDAFCSDNFPAVYRRFTVAAERTSKLTLLLELVPADELAARLLECPYAALEDNPVGSNLPTGQRNSAHDRLVSDKLELLYQSKELLMSSDRDCTEIEGQIGELKRELRKGPQLRIGEVLADRYSLIHVIGKGGFAEVWRAYDRKQRCLVAVKVLHGQWCADRSRIERFVRGACKMAVLSHPGIVRVHERPAAYEGFHFFVMEYLTGGNLAEAVCAGRITTAEGLHHIITIGRALAYAHEQGLIHRDVKPQNVLLDECGQAFLADFDLVHCADTSGGTRTGPLGTMIYAPPEELEDAGRVDVRADVYSLGMTAVFVLFGRELPLRVLQSSSDFMAKLNTTAAVRSVLLRAISWDCDVRHPDMATFLVAFEAAMHSSAEQSTSNPPSLHDVSVELSALPPTASRWRPSVVHALLLLGVVGAAVIFGLRFAASDQDKSSALPADPNLVYIPGGNVLFNLEDKNFNAETGPFYIARHEVTVKEYKECVKQRGCSQPSDTVHWEKITDEDRKLYSPFCNTNRPGREDHPINCITWAQAEAFCRSRGMRLPNIAELHLAAFGSKRRRYPWGNEQLDASRLNACGPECIQFPLASGQQWYRDTKMGTNILIPNTYRPGSSPPPAYPVSDGYPTTAPVGSFPLGATPLGVRDLDGNVSEYTSTPHTEAHRGYWVFGSSYNETDPNLIGAKTESFATQARCDTVGFRCVKPVE